MIIIAHRGNLFGESEEENKPDFIDKALLMGFDVEIDLWYRKKDFFLGHDYPQYLISNNWLNERNKKLWIHCKNKECLSKMIQTEFHYFWHQKDNYTLTSKNYIWSFPGYEINSKKCIKVLPEKTYKKINKNLLEIDSYGGICSDYVYKYKDLII